MNSLVNKISILFLFILNGLVSLSQCDWSVNAITNSLSCHGDCTGRIEFFVQQGTSPYSYVWEDNDISAVKQNLCGGTYAVTISDNGSCDTIVSVVVVEPDEILITITGVDSMCEDNNAAVNVEVSGGSNQYIYLWQNGSATQNISGLQSGEYEVLVSDVRNCSAIASTSVTSIEKLEISATKKDDICKLLGEIQIDYWGGTEPYEVFVNENLISKTSFENLDPGNYIFEIEDVNSCYDSIHLAIAEIPCSDPIPEEAFTPNGDGINDTWRIQNIEQYPNALIIVYDRWGQLVLNKRGGYNLAWRGNNNIQDVPAGAYYYIIYKDGDNQGDGMVSGSVSIVR